VGFTDAIKTCFQKYVTFSGRASRPEYWWFMLFLFLGNIVAGVIDYMLFGAATVESDVTSTGASFDVSSNGPVAALFGLATILPSLAAGWRRMHDTGRSGFYLLYPLIVMVGLGMFLSLFGGMDAITGAGGAPALSGIFAIIALVAVIILIISPFLVLWWLTRPSQRGANEYGPNPREVTP